MSYCPDGKYKNHIEVAHSYCNKLLVLCSHTQHRRKDTRLDLATGEKFSHAKCIKILQLMVHSRCGQLINSVGFMCLHATKCLSTLTVKALLIILPKRSLIESRQWNGKEKKKKQHEDAVNLQAHGVPFLETSLGPQGNILCSPPFGGPDRCGDRMNLRKFAFPVEQKNALAFAS